MSRLSDGVNGTEHQAAIALLKLAEAIQEVCYYSEQTVPAATRREFHRIYRILKPVAISYCGENHPLIWDAPDYRFQKKGSK
jgi:hypothetical protein